ncbi:MAG: hypothetical protein ABJA79_01935 [Parafilimonas sp.]
MNCGFLYVAMGKKYLMEAQISARSLKRFTQYPVAVITDDAGFKSDLFDIIIYNEPSEDFITKILGVKQTPFQRTVFLDTDTFVCSSINDLFSVLDLFDMAMTIDNFIHGYPFFKKYNPAYFIRYEKIIPEYNTGVIVFSNNNKVMKLFESWLKIHKAMHIKADMPSFREALIENAATVGISPLPFEYNFHGIKSFGFVYNEIKIIHERLGERWSTLTEIMLPYEKMDRLAKRINKHKGKRIIIPYMGVITSAFSPYSIKNKLKRMFGIKKTKKAETF